MCANLPHWACLYDLYNILNIVYVKVFTKLQKKKKNLSERLFLGMVGISCRDSGACEAFTEMLFSHAQRHNSNEECLPLVAKATLARSYQATSSTG